MRTVRNIGVWMAACGLLLIGGVQGRSQQPPCATRPCVAVQSSPNQSVPGSGRSGSQTQTQPQISPNMSEPPEGPLDTRLEQDQAKMRNTERQKKLIDDTARLVNLANELKTDVEKSNKDTMSLDVIRKADEIEKLARSVKEKMKGM